MHQGVVIRPVGTERVVREDMVWVMTVNAAAMRFARAPLETVGRDCGVKSELEVVVECKGCC